ncbi:hypothetical protein [Novosphingobium sp. Gsoil 351]|uniref:hypothetical protein n=1 Tax=Novosphingobium sp. Gsoil 351 TaxID=2675225 RepID=UPI0012B4A69C|nr:hypothetical protein [Novosphingobium sp. Gsoil 351]QGN55953.1 hypothetical protein GKE62_16720 [Novosphingobium sp. Gsoil 351]
MIHSRRTLMAAALACLMAGGCDKKAPEGNKATGEVLEGTISDAMIAPDRIRAEPPLAPHTAKSPGAKGDKEKAKPDDTVKDAPEPDAVPTPETSPIPKPAASEPAG